MTLNPRPARIFTREQPCTKVDLHNCFYPEGIAVRRAVVEARGEIGLNAIKYLKREGYATAFEASGVDYWQLTPEGLAWLSKGLARHLELHPEDAPRVNPLARTAPRTARRPRSR